MRFFGSLFSFVMVSFAVGPAHAEADQPTSYEVRRTEHHWYGWQNLSIDAGALALMATAAGTQSAPLGWGSVAAWAVGSSVVHFAHGREGAAFASVGMRVVFPVVGGVIGGNSMSCGPEGDSCDYNKLFAGIAIGALTAMVIDDAVLANEEVEKPEYKMFPTTSFVRSPDGKSSTFTLGLAGTF